MELPSDGRLDATLAVLRRGYRFISEGCAATGSDAFRTRIMLKPVICMRGREAARLVYDGDRVTRAGAMPSWVIRLLQGKGSVEVLSGARHHHRKRMFLDRLEPGRFDGLIAGVEREWRAMIPEWSRRGRIELLREARLVMVRATFRWAGIPVDDDAPDAVSADTAADWCAAMIENVASFGPAHIRARRLRREADAWSIGLVEAARRPGGGLRADTLLSAFAAHREQDGTLLEARIVAYELFNVLRPSFAIARFVVFAAAALADHPQWRDRLRRRPGEIRAFVQEVRRLAPFFPFIGGIALEPLDYQGVRIERGEWMLFDLYGTNRHPSLWREPERFEPERFVGAADEAIDPYGFVPQGGGDHATGHRCAGEWATIATMEAVVGMLVREMEYEVPAQDRSVRLDRFPAGPASGFLIERIRPIATPTPVAVAS